MKKYIRYIVGVVVVVAVAVIAAVGYVASQPKPDKVFRDYLKTMSDTKEFAAQENYSGTGTVANVNWKLDTAKKMLVSLADISCSGQIDSKPVEAKISYQTDNASSYLKFDTVKGTIIADDGSVVDLTKLFSKIVGQWYKLPDDPALQSELDSGVFVSSDGVIAPSYDAEKISTSLLSNDAIKYTSSKRSGNNLVFEITSTKNNFQTALKQTFPNLSKPDLILDSVFDTDTSSSLKITVSRDGNFISETTSTSNICSTLFEQYIGKTATQVPATISGEVKKVSPETINIAPINSSKPLDDMTNDIVL